MSVSLRAVALGVAIADVSHGVVEVGGNNMGPRVSWYLHNCDPPINTPAPWCAAFVQGCSDIAARGLNVPNPLDAVKLEALVISYYEWAKKGGLLVPAEYAEPGDLAFFDFHPGTGNAWDHIAFVVEPPGSGAEYRTVEGNTGTENERDGDGVAFKPRSTALAYSTAFARWAP